MAVAPEVLPVRARSGTTGIDCVSGSYLVGGCADSQRFAQKNGVRCAENCLSAATSR